MAAARVCISVTWSVACVVVAVVVGKEAAVAGGGAVVGSGDVGAAGRGAEEFSDIRPESDTRLLWLG